MTHALALAAAVAVGLVLILFGLRRLVLLGASLLPERALPAPTAELPELALVVAARNEAETLPRLFGALDALTYPPERLLTIIVDDSSTDSTGTQLARWSNVQPRRLAVALPEQLGKAAALDAGIAAAGASEVIVVCDADLRPEPDSLQELARPFADATVGATAGYVRPENASATPVSRYAAVETWMTQLVTSAGKDRLDLNPPTLGFCAYRRTAFEEIGSYGEDLVATVRLTRSGWVIRFVPAARADNLVVHRLRDYWRQHARWTGNTFDAGRAGGGAARAPILRRIETWLMSAGYADRLALLAAAGLAAAGAMPVWLPPSYLGLRGLEVVVALLKGGVRAQLPVFVFWTVVFFALDIVASVAATAQYARGRSRAWRSPSRTASG